ncbi:E3 ubiquitin-protein ligase MARCHF7 isoform X2 [Chanos chanos]|uniref:RING-type E3 ubiquitin transferase n=1 Tax=Chanos chanos TaxID=29144 RepID=A0A6J2W0Q1_CHACN|nr:E3 ubiquitin-protein ligase MARCH7 isoform X2 [Chanos chanos]
MDSKPRRLPFSVSSSSSLSSPSSLSSSSALGSSRLYGRGSVLSSDRFSRGTPVKLDTDYQSSRFLGSTRDYTSAESRHPSWKLSTPLSASSSVSCDRPWAESSVGSRNKPVDSERRLGSYSGLLSSAQDSETKRAKLSYTNRAGYTRPSSSAGSTSASGLYSGLGSNTDSSWKSLSSLSRSSSSTSSTSSSSSSSSSSADGLWARRDLEKRNESVLGDSSTRSSGLSSLYRPERVTSTYAQGARPKESLYSSRRESGSTSRRLSSDYLSSPLGCDSHRPSSDYQPSGLTRDSPRSSSSSSSSSLRTPSTSLSDASRLSSWSASPYTPLSERSTSPPSSSPAPIPAPAPVSAPENEEPDGRRSTRRLLSRLFSRRSSQDTSSTPSPASRSFDSASDDAVPDAAPPTAGNESEETEVRGSDPVQAFAFLRRRSQGQGLTPVQESVNPGVEPEALRGTGGLAWLSWNRCTPLFSRRRREGQEESSRMEARRTSQYPLSGRDENKAPDRDARREEEEDDDDNEDEESEGATAARPAGASGLSASLLQDAARLAGRSHGVARVMTSPLFRRPENVMIAVDIGGSGRGQADGQAKDKPAPSRDPEKLRKIQESLLLEDSDEEEGDLCRICQMGEESSSNPLIEPCRCTGSLQYVHQECIKKWLRSKISSGSNLDAITTCELCKEKLHLDIENFDINELYRSHERSEYEFISCGLYLVVLLHLCEQRFSDVLGAANDAGFFNLARTLHEHMDNLESSYVPDSDDEDTPDNRPSIDFCDLEEEDEEEEY